MSCKNTMLSCASAIALSLAMAQPALAAEEAAKAAAPAAEEAAKAAAPASVAQAPATAEPTVPTVEAAPIETPAMAAPPPHMEPRPMPPGFIEQLEQHRKQMTMLPEERWEARRAELNKRYGDLRTRAADAGMNFPEAAPWNREPEWLTYDQMRNQMQERGIELPEQPAWPGQMGMSDEERQTAQDAMQEKIGKMRKMQEELAAMNAEVRAAFREQRYREMRERAASRGMERPELPPWKRPSAAGPAPALAEPPAQQPAEGDWSKYQAIIAGMSPEEREACMAMHRMHMQQRMQQAPRPMATPEGYDPGYGYGHGRGYGPRWGQWQGYPE